MKPTTPMSAMSQGGTFMAATLVVTGGIPIRVGRPPDLLDAWIATHAEPFYIRP